MSDIEIDKLHMINDLTLGKYRCYDLSFPTIYGDYPEGWGDTKEEAIEDLKKDIARFVITHAINAGQTGVVPARSHTPFYGWFDSPSRNHFEELKMYWLPKETQIRIFRLRKQLRQLNRKIRITGYTTRGQLTQLREIKAKLAELNPIPKDR